MIQNGTSFGSQHLFPIKHLRVLLREAKHRIDLSYLLQGCLKLELHDGAVIGPQQLPPYVEAVQIVLHSVESIVAHI
jgi:hypothetical protein